MDFLCFFINNILLNIKIKILNEKETRRIIIQGIITYLEPYTLYIEHKIITKVAIHKLKGVLVYKTLEFKIEFDIKSLHKVFSLSCN